MGLLVWSWVALRASVGDTGPLPGICTEDSPGSLSGPMWAILCRLEAFAVSPGPSWVRSSVLCWRSLAALGVYVRGLGPHVGGLGSLLGPPLAVLGRLA